MEIKCFEECYFSCIILFQEIRNEILSFAFLLFLWEKALQILEIPLHFAKCEPLIRTLRYILDIWNAFDKVWQKGLLYKLKQNGILGKLFDIISNFLNFRKQRVVLQSTCIRRRLLGPLKSGCFGQVIILWNTFIKQPQPKSGRSWWVFSFYSHCECFINSQDLLE